VGQPDYILADGYIVPEGIYFGGHGLTPPPGHAFQQFVARTIKSAWPTADVWIPDPRTFRRTGPDLLGLNKVYHACSSPGENPSFRFAVPSAAPLTSILHRKPIS
jgi:hypothetical protein